MSARCDVLFPGAAQASMHVEPGGGFRMAAGKQLALSCRMTWPCLYSLLLWKSLCKQVNKAEQKQSKECVRLCSGCFGHVQGRLGCRCLNCQCHLPPPSYPRMKRIEPVNMCISCKVCSVRRCAVTDRTLELKPLGLQHLEGFGHWLPQRANPHVARHALFVVLAKRRSDGWSCSETIRGGRRRGLEMMPLT